MYVGIGWVAALSHQKRLADILQKQRMVAVTCFGFFLYETPGTIFTKGLSQALCFVCHQSANTFVKGLGVFTTKLRPVLVLTKGITLRQVGGKWS